MRRLPLIAPSPFRTAPPARAPRACRSCREKVSPALPIPLPGYRPYGLIGNGKKAEITPSAAGPGKGQRLLKSQTRRRSRCVRSRRSGQDMPRVPSSPTFYGSFGPRCRKGCLPSGGVAGRRGGHDLLFLKNSRIVEAGIGTHSVEGPDRASGDYCPAESGCLIALIGAINRGRVYGSAAPLQRQKLINIGLVSAFEPHSPPS